MKSLINILFVCLCSVLFTTTNLAQWLRVYSQSGAVNSMTKYQSELYAGGNGVFHSSNHGESWTPQGTNTSNIKSIAVTEPALYVVRTSGSNPIYTTTDGGNDWVQTIGGIIGFSTYYTLVVKDTLIFVGGQYGRVFKKSTALGTNWILANSNLPQGSSQHHIFTLAVNGDTVFAGGNSGLHYSLNDGTSWSSPAALTNDTVYVIATAPGNSSIMYAGTKRGFFRSTDGGATWNISSANVPGTRVLSIASTNNGEAVFVGTNGSGVFLTLDNGSSWIPVNTGLTNGIINALAVSDTSLLAGVQGSLINGIWRRPLFQMLNEVSLVSPVNGAIQHLSLELKWNKVIGASSYNVQVSTNQSFTNIVVNNTATDTALVVGPLEDTTTYYWRVRARNGVLGGPFSPGWTFTTVGIPPSQVEPIFPAHGSQIGSPVNCTWASSNPFVTHYWFELALDSLFSTGLIIDSSLIETSKLITDIQTNTTYWWRVRARNIVGWGPYSDGRNFYVTVTDVSENGELPTEFGMYQNFPNPFNPTTNIQFQIPTTSFVELKVFDMLGKEVTTLVNEELSPGFYKIDFDGSGLASGVYFYRIKAGAFVQTRKLILQK